MESDTASIKAAYVCPRIVCFTVELSLCAISPLGGGHKDATPGESLEEIEEEEETP
jgi:conserved domain protein